MKTATGLLLGLCLLASPALAGGDVCVLHGASTLVLTKPKLPKARAAAPLHGFFDLAGNPPVHGTIMRGTTGGLIVGFTDHFADGNACFAHLAIDEAFEGAGSLRCTSDLADDIAVTWARIDLA